MKHLRKYTKNTVKYFFLFIIRHTNNSMYQYSPEKTPHSLLKERPTQLEYLKNSASMIHTIKIKRYS